MESEHRPSVLDSMTEWARKRGVFGRNKVPIQRKVTTAIMGSSGMSYREIAKIVGGISYVAARDARIYFERGLPAPAKKYRGRISLEESVIELNGTKVCFWLAKDLETGEILAVRASKSASEEESEKFQNRVLEFCNNRPLAVIDRGWNYPKSLRNLDLKFQIGTVPGIRGRPSRAPTEKPENTG